jgi:hypothetical protein
MINLPCDGCGLPASPQHIADRLRRLELSTRYRPVHIGVLFVALSPAVRAEDDFYGPAESKEFFDPFLEALDIPQLSKDERRGTDGSPADVARLMEFQRRGYYMVYVSECPIPKEQESSDSTIARLAPTLIRRIRFNYRPKHIAPLGDDLFPLADLMKKAGLVSILTLPNGRPLPIPRLGGREDMELVRSAVAGVAHGETPALGYDRIQLRQRELDLGAGGDS